MLDLGYHIYIYIYTYELLHGVIGGSADSISKLLRSFHGTHFEGESFMSDLGLTRGILDIYELPWQGGHSISKLLRFFHGRFIYK